MLCVLGVLQGQLLVRSVNHVRFAEVSYALQRRWLSWRALVPPVVLLVVVERNLGELGDAGADVGIRRHKAHALRVPASWPTAAAVWVLLRLGWVVRTAEYVFDQRPGGLLGLVGRRRLRVLMAEDGLRRAGENRRRDVAVSGSGRKILKGSRARVGLCLLLQWMLRLRLLLLLEVELARGGGELREAMGLGARHLVGEIVFALTRVKCGRDTVGVLQLRRAICRIGAAGSGAVDIDQVWRRWRGLCVITPAGAGVGLKGFAGAEGRVGRG